MRVSKSRVEDRLPTSKQHNETISLTVMHTDLQLNTDYDGQENLFFLGIIIESKWKNRKHFPALM